MKKEKNRRAALRRWMLLPLFVFSLALCLLDFSGEERGIRSLRSPGTELSSAFTGVKQQALDGITTIRKTYRLAPGTLAPAPDENGYGVAETADEILALFEEAKLLLNGREPLFSADTPFLSEYGIHYYYDESILALVWCQNIMEDDWEHFATFSEVFLSDASQFRRKLSDDVFGAGAHKFPTDMAMEVNAVLASSGDFYRFRPLGMCVYDGVLYRLDTEKVDSCGVDENGDLIFIPAGTLQTEEEANAFIQEHHIDFTLSFGPIMIENHEPVYHSFYALGEANIRYPRCCLAQDGPLHYIEMVLKDHATVWGVTQMMMELGVERCYALDGGQTGTIVMQGTALNPSIYGYGNGAQRVQSDIIYFASAIPESERRS